MSDASKRKEKQKWATEKPKLDNARKLRGMYFIDPDDEQFKNIMTNARGQLEIPMPAAMPCKLKVTSTGRPVAHAWKDLLTRFMKIILHEKDQFIGPLQCCAQIYSYASSNEDIRCKKQ